MVQRWCEPLTTICTVERPTGREHNVQELPRCEGNLVQVLESARKLLGTVIQKSAKLHDLFFREMPEYPTLAWQEALVNAIAHRDYGIQGRSVEVWLFEDRMEVVSPGGLLPEVHLEDLQARRAVHASRNPRLARVLVELDIMREQGEGIPRMFEEMEESWLPMPELVADASSFRVILRNEPIFASSDPDWVRTVQGLHLDARQKRTLIRFVEGDFANGDYQEMNGVDLDQSYRELQQLVELGLLATTGQGKGMRYHVVRTGAIRGEAHVSVEAATANGAGNVVLTGDTPAAAQQSPLDELKLRMREAGFITNADYCETYRTTRRLAKTSLAAWIAAGTLMVEGRGRSVRYLPGPKWPPDADRERPVRMHTRRIPIANSMPGMLSQPPSTPSCRVPEGHDAHDSCCLVDLVIGVVANSRQETSVEAAGRLPRHQAVTSSICDCARGAT
jgi:hypothetical protein